MDNLLRETIEELASYELTPADVRWVGSQSGDYSCTWVEFAEIANIEYSDGYGTQLIAKDLVVVGDGWWLERHEYDGSEWWEHKSLPKQADYPRPIQRVIAPDIYSTGDVEKLNKEAAK